MSLVTKIRRSAVGATAAMLGAALLAVVPAGPANALPDVQGEFFTSTATQVQPIRAKECTDPIQLHRTVDLQGIGNALAAQGYTVSGSKDPVYTALYWSWSYRITGPDNFYYSTSGSYAWFPTSESWATIELCPDDFGTDTVPAGTYTVETTLTAYTGDGTARLCHPTDGCQKYDNLYRRVITTPVALNFSQACLDAKAQTPTLRKAVKKAKRVLKKAKKARNKAKIRKAKKQLKRAKTRLSKNLTVVGNSC